MSILRSLAAAAAVTTLFVLAGCSAGSASLPEAQAPADAAADRSGGYTGANAAPEELPADIPGTTVKQQVARTARVAITVTDVEAAATMLRQVAAGAGGQVTAENLVTRADVDSDRGPVSTMVISVPADKLDSTLEQLKSAGTLTSRVISSDDVTTQVADVESRIATLNGSIARLRELSDKAGSIRDLTQLEAELTNRISERDSLVAQQKSLAGRVALSPITITLSTPERASVVETTGFLGGLLAGWNALVSSTRVLLTILGAVLPFLAVLAVVAVPLVIWRRRRGGSARTPVERVERVEQPSTEEQV